MAQRIAVVTGASSGIGLAVAQALAAHGDQVVLADVNEEAGNREAEKIGGFFVKADLSTKQGCRSLADAVLAKYGRCDILVNNAGIQHVSPIEEFPEEKWEFIINLMLTAPFLLCKYFWPSMKENGWGRVINLNSVHGLRASEFKVAYVSAKHGMTGLTKTLALEGAQFGITVNNICPGYVRTPLVDGQIEDQAKTHGISREEVLEKVLLKKQAIKRMVEPSELGEAVLYICSDAARCMTGVSLTIDCGWSAS
ncbi:MAG: 3-hydroxybutyrate dehydrogenase [Deltaproteobacteria bacterium]|jgi:3-hydroxybutyrate dehydrogenase|nr:3-hydroxybutyrate dehydrogenase [Deltaproteobacteria bacterium]MCW8892943.1 3-hydroxybutyrate dehydrogenase [Deltaproteobacteria bacterium]MCW9050372.1 3-hydroxybutyrate dehydrogenase [Deltaproteobacteria bacterium]